MAYKLGEPTVQQYFDANGDPLVNGSIEFYVTGTSTPAAVASDSAGGATATSYTLNSIGAPQTAGGTAIALYFDDTVTYKIVRKDAAGTVIDPTIDPYNVVNSAGGQLVVDSVATLYSNDQSAFTNATTQAFTAGGTVGRADWYKSGTGGTPTTAGTLLTDLALGYVVDAGGNYWYLVLDGTNTVYQFGATGSGDDYDEINAGLTLINSNGGGYLYGDTHTVNTTLTIPNKVTLDLRSGSLIPGSDIDVVYVRPGGRLRNLDGDYTAATLGFSFTSEVVSLVPTSNAQGRRYQEWLDNVVIQLTLGSGTGYGLTVDASTYYVMEMRCSNVAIWGGERAINLVAGTGSQWVTHCVFNNIALTDNVYHIYNANDCSGNTYIGSTEKNTYGQFRFTGSNNKFYGLIQDSPAIEFAEDNSIRCDGNNLLSVAGEDMVSVTDAGFNNRIIGDGYEYYNRASVSTYRDDWRNNINAGGRMEFRDMMISGPSPMWTQAVTATGAISAADAEFGAAAGFEQNYSYTLLNCPADNDTVKLDFNGVKAWATGRRPIIHMVFGDSDEDGLFRAGLYNDANNYILLKYDGTNTGGATGAGEITVESANGGSTSSVVISSTTMTNRLNYITLVISDSTIDVYYGEWNFANSGSTGQLSKGIDILPNTADGSITTNIPVQVRLQPYIYLEADGAATSAKIFNYQIVSNYKEFR